MNIEITIADTVGYFLPTEVKMLVKNIKNNVSNIDKALLSVHCHDDLGMSVANSISAIESGIQQVHCTINGIGKRVFSPLFYPLLIGVDIFKAFTQRLFEMRSVSTCTFYWLKKEYICPQDYSL